jgi:hypothetical protein
MIQINSPCNESWNAMHPAENGRYCDRCCKVVVDFSNCTNDEIIGFFSENSGKRVCGRFKVQQVDRPKPKMRLSRFLAGLVIAFGGFLFSACGSGKDTEHLAGDVAYVPDSAQVAKLKADSAKIADSISNLPH